MPTLEPVTTQLATKEPGVVYTKPWVIEVILDLAGYTSDRPLFELVALEPSAGDGAFLRGMVRRLVASCTSHKIPLTHAKEALRAYEIDPVSAARATAALREELVSLGVNPALALELATSWVVAGDFLEASLGFPVADFVIGNPPYIRLEDVSAEKSRFYRGSFSAMRGRADIYIAFYQAALLQLKPGGVCAYICADRWLLNEYGASLREFITDGFAVNYIVETHDVEAFEDAVSAYPAITVISKNKQGSVVVAKALPEIERAPTDYVVSHLREARSNSVIRAARFEAWFQGSQPWACSNPDTLAILTDIEERFPLLESDETQTKVGIGVATGADKVFITKALPDIEDDRVVRLAMAYDLDESEVKWSGHYLINPWDTNGLVDLAAYPRMERYLSSHSEVLKKRHTAKDRPSGWHKTIDRVNLGLLARPKLYIADIKDRLLPSLDRGQTYPHHNVYWITSGSWDLRVLGALLMSDVGEFFIRSYGVKMRGGYFRFQAQYLRRIRVPNPSSITASVAKGLIQAFDTRDKKLATELALKLYGIPRLPARE